MNQFMIAGGLSCALWLASIATAQSYTPPARVSHPGMTLPAPMSYPGMPLEPPASYGVPSVPSDHASPRSFVADRGVEYPNGRPDTYADLEYLLWGFDGLRLPSLLTSNPAGTALDQVARPDNPSTQTVIGHEDTGDWSQHGMRLRVGRMYCGGLVSRLEFTGFFLFDGSQRWSASSENGNPILARPFTNAMTGQPDAQVLSYPDVASGSLDANYKRRLYSFDPLFFVCLAGDGSAAWESFSGYRFMRYEDELRTLERVRPLTGSLIVPGSELVVEDVFRASNNYHVIPLGLSYVEKFDAWRFDARAQISLGFVHQEVAIRGRTDALVPGDFDTSSVGGFLALHSNMGTHDRTEFAWIPELNLTLRRCLRGGLWVHAGYTLMYLNDVVHAPHHLDTTLDPNQFPPAIAPGDRPAFAFQSSDEWIHGLNTGLQWNY